MKKLNLNKNKIKKALICSTCVLVASAIIAGIAAFIANYPDEKTPTFEATAKQVEKKPFL